ncbi:sodium-dependent phosphate transport protein 4 isoform X3 [Canis lupus baileyi]|uniref:sodium-dependent phosphate transport protein 4 isoform X3 n=1 Tax=Canis lupus dingo TaxID=286419 RepID=UPI0003ADFF36|nr:sodium-dependent phosphate transport protein 4 isoform X3 [Canis lupus dingo]XP_038302453.1 sodium-dependent phosphate transport protein 4 isoform X3 [Canis lupus familiaris]XP_038319037.1 sodium-dependent phosphate transport protein 4 isoform X3 [Canis lupus familiaris]XP_038440257.1 sodium-dependent phosphate transport protein 4 isoform X3 [Canis lupus familiaris]|eukprot:XP_005640160.1 sodium-dependent phosphate transport protein 4 isoform X3 [Canis lupus familiaris]
MAELSPTAGESNYSQDIQVDEKLVPKKGLSLCSTRYGIALIIHVCNFIAAAQSTVINITMVAMVNTTDHQFQFNGSTEQLPGGPNNAPDSLPAEAPTYDWSPQIQGIIFASAAYGMTLTMALSGYLAGRVGTKRVVGVSLFASSLLIIFSPLAAELGLISLIATRMVQGLVQGSIFGGQNALWERWGPPHERSRLCTIALSGMLLGTFTITLVGGLISQTLGWPFAFYIFGGIGCVYCPFWFILIYDDPVSHPWINVTEKEYIISSLAQQIHNGLLSALPFIIAWVIGILGGYLADFLLTKNVRLVTVRKIATFLGNFPSSALLVALPYLPPSYITTMTFLTLSCGLSPLCQSGIYINALDLAPRYSSFLMGTTRGLANIAALLAPTVSGFLLNQDSEFGWRNVFLLLFAINLSGLIFYLICGDAVVQDWAKGRKLTRL